MSREGNRKVMRQLKEKDWGVRTGLGRVQKVEFTVGSVNNRCHYHTRERMWHVLGMNKMEMLMEGLTKELEVG